MSSRLLSARHESPGVRLYTGSGVVRQQDKVAGRQTRVWQQVQSQEVRWLLWYFIPSGNAAIVPDSINIDCKHCTHWPHVTSSGTRLTTQTSIDRV